MNFKKTFCSSPWFHIRLNNTGTYEPCRWQSGPNKKEFDPINNISNISPLTYFQNHMSQFRSDMLSGKKSLICNDCYIMEEHGKVSGRQRQLLKSGIQEQYFEKSLISSPMKPSFDYSFANNGKTDHFITDWQIDLGNYCNSNCVFCGPKNSSRLATEYKQLGLINELPPANWCDNEELVKAFVEDLKTIPDMQYLHFIGGETLITPAFKKILTELAEADLAKNIVVGFTTNLTVWQQSMIDLLAQFKQINLGMSVETLTPINDYVRYPSQISQVQELLDRWVDAGRQHDWLMQLRTTPTCLTLHELTTVYDYAWKHDLSVESCNFLDRPEYMRISVLPIEYRNKIKQEISTWLEQHVADSQTKVINTRDPNVSRSQLVQDVQSYLNYLSNTQDESHRLPDLIKYLKLIESNRGNSILTYLPQYEELFRSAGY